MAYMKRLLLLVLLTMAPAFAQGGGGGGGGTCIGCWEETQCFSCHYEMNQNCTSCGISMADPVLMVITFEAQTDGTKIIHAYAAGSNAGKKALKHGGVALRGIGPKADGQSFNPPEHAQWVKDAKPGTCLLRQPGRSAGLP
jgi:hypothetical protein